MKILDGKLVSEKIKKELASEINLLKKKPMLVVIQIGDNAASTIYINNKRKMASSLGIDFKHIKYDSDEKEEKIIKQIEKLNNDKEVSGIIVQLPLPSGYNKDKIINSINVNKDIDGLTYESVGRLCSNDVSLVPCTPSGIIELLNYYNINVSGKNVVIVGRSNLVGKPLYNLLLQKDATVTMCHSKTVNLKNVTKKADILIVAVGKKNFITKDMISKNTVVIDVGINRVDNKLYGDVDFEKVAKKASFITPVPGGVGPMTVTMLMKNTLTAYYKNK